MFKIQAEYERAPGVQDETLARTWAQLRITIGDSPVTQLVDKEADSVRSCVYGSAFPLAEWIVNNWWFLTNESCRVRTVESGRQLALRDEYRPWVQRHSFLAAREGNALPDLILYRDNGTVVAKWFQDPATNWKTSPVRFIAEGQTELRPEEVEQTLASLVQSVIKRIDNLRTEDAERLKANWNAVKASRMHEDALCRCAALLGLDPYDVEQLSPKLASFIERRVLKLDAQLRTDLLEAIRPDGLRNNLDWILEALKRAPRIRQDQANGPETEPRTATDFPTSSGTTAHDLGYLAAKTFRKEFLGLKPDDPIEDLNKRVARILGWPEDFEVELAPPDPEFIDGLLWRSKGQHPLVFGASLPDYSQRFRMGRALYHAVAHPDKAASRLITRAHTWDQRASRAFSAELLAPAAALQKQLSGHVSTEDISRLSNKYRVSTLVVTYQVENHGLGQVALS